MSKMPYIFFDGRLDTKNASIYLGLSVKTLAQFRCKSEGPPFIKPTGRVFYYKDDLDAWLNRTGRVNSTAQANFALNNN